MRQSWQATWRLCFWSCRNELNTPKNYFAQPTETDSERQRSRSATRMSYFCGVGHRHLIRRGLLLAGDDNMLVNDTAVRPGNFSLATNTPVAGGNAPKTKETSRWPITRCKDYRRVLLRTAGQHQVETNRLAMRMEIMHHSSLKAGTLLAVASASVALVILAGLTCFCVEPTQPRIAKARCRA